MRITKKNIEAEFNKCTKDYWRNSTREIDYKNSASFFPDLNRLFRKENKDNVIALDIQQNELPLLAENNLNPNDFQCNNNITHVDDTKVLPNIIGSYFEKINSQESSIESTLDNIVKSKAESIKADLSVLVKPTIFDNVNKASNPKPNVDIGFTNVIEVKSLIKRMSNKTSTGRDEIPNIVIKNLTLKIIRDYTILFNNAINNGYFPNAWKTAKLIVLKKKKDSSTSLDLLRPISLLPPISKILERIINKQLVDFCSEKDIIPNQQFGFKKNHSTIHAITKLLSDINWHLLKNEMVGAALIDLRKAFDSVWLDGLLYKLDRLKVPKHLLKLSTNMITDRNFKVSLNNIESDRCYKITRGLQQGTVNSPLLFNIYTAETLNMFELNSNNNTYALAFADDLIVYVANKNLKNIELKLQELYDKIKLFYGNWKLEINPNKCETILFRDILSNKSAITKKNWKKFNIKDKGETVTEIPHKRIVKYLGVNIDDLLRLGHHVNVQLSKAKNVFRKLHKLFYSPYLDAKAKIISYLCLIRPIIAYACPVWWNISPCYMEKIRSFERKCLRICLNYYREPHDNFKKRTKNQKIYKIAKIPRVDIFLIKLTRNHIKKSINNNNNQLIRGPFFPRDEFYKNAITKGFVPPETFIYLDENKYIINKDSIPMFYHISRHINNKKINYDPAKMDISDCVYDTNITKLDKNLMSNFKYYKE